MDHTLTLRRARPADLAAVDRLLSRSYPRLLKGDYPPSVLVTALPIISRARPELLASGRYFLAEAEDGQVIGAGGWSAAVQSSGEVAPQTAHIRHVAVDPSRLRQGVGSAVMSEVIVDTLRHGIRWLDCMSTRTAIPFYDALGFRVLHEVDVPLAPGIVFPAVRMMRQISP
ncbi:GNAT family N-acetyltransferase [Fuscovulum ytuae]|uniref:GNAT family N-acetyltransferase n=1 Tax=Fuscovulum ytuae TaxID=3042299 RepID=A0ABY8QAY1_9RHOB|nr:GNAT family N-acetyltransferase [Fuscovulum sp. YMD61]WGV17651.1 GNAT family N-acetyltransferase [Fuscovulum sp. YMD61]